MTWTSPETIDIANGGFLAVLTYLNNVTLGVFPLMLMLSVLVIGIWVSYKSSGDFSTGFAVTTFGVFVISLLFWIGGFLAPIWFGVSIALLIVGGAFVIFDR